MSTDLRTRLADVIQADRLRRAAAQWCSVARAAIEKLKQDVKRLQDERAAVEVRRATHNGNGHGTREEAEDAVTNAIPVQKPEGWLHGQAYYRDEEEA